MMKTRKFTTMKLTKEEIMQKMLDSKQAANPEKCGFSNRQKALGLDVYDSQGNYKGSYADLSKDRNRNQVPKDDLDR